MSRDRAAREARVVRLGVITLVVMALVSAATFNLGKFPGFRGTTYYAEFSDASGIHKGNIVQVGGIRAGRVSGVELAGDRVKVKFEIDGDVEFGSDSHASIEVLNLLGEKYLDLQPVGKGQLADGATIPMDRTKAAYDIVGVFGDLTTTTEEIDTDQLSRALDTVADTLDVSAPEIKASFDGISRLSRSVAARDAEIQTLFESSQQVSKVLADRSDDIVSLMKSSDLVFKELTKRKAAVHDLLVNARSLAVELRGVVKDNEAQIAPALKEVDGLVSFLVSKKQKIKETLAALGPYVSILSNIIGTGPWFDAYASNLLALPTGEFVPGFQG
ncbi:MCE family protein [Pimelobacter simplex]|uniref:MCE-family protein MceC n=1 Tax=Nocardioides simplex TaxID=2045 RepID=A0A0A1DL83_NOCSI|nr:MlaD family protein [Pimelobacter simplex]AIY17328.1 MCE-family protein MceC [Pimelobacter simplex]MCG8151433.1 MCE family protein [Pimelobacter simplex]GEB13379.1 ABC transporter substrate-binding protein [Pimelobacter simplex]SFM45595.1 phospholipid/cholesterol/gamma-HCH transport system substrate-binding protein [Pimelobacter simplex]